MPPSYDWLLNRLPVRRRLGFDTISQENHRTARFAPMPMSRLKLTGNLHQDVVAGRSVDPGLTIDHDRHLAVIIPFRNREAHLAALLPDLEGRLQGHCSDYRVFVVEQVPGRLFNRGRLINIGAHIAGDRADYFCIHDVDMVPVTAEYGCPSQPLRLVKRLTQTFRPVNEFRDFYFSGSIALRREQFLEANGFDNDYWGSGSQDEDFFIRCLLRGMIPYEDREGLFMELDNPDAERHYRTRRIRRGNKRRMIWQCFRRTVGRSGISNLRYRLVATDERERVTRIRVEI